MNKIKKILIGASVATLLLFGGAAYASIPDSDGVFHACVKNTAPHDIKMLDPAGIPTEHCNSGFTEKTWNQVGPIGPAGPVGPQGDPASVPAHTLYGVYEVDITHTIAANSHAGDSGTAFPAYCAGTGDHSDAFAHGDSVLLNAFGHVEPGSSEFGVDSGTSLISAHGNGQADPRGALTISWNHTNTDSTIIISLICAHAEGLSY